MRFSVRSRSNAWRRRALAAALWVCAWAARAQTFEDITQAAGVAFVATDGSSGRHLFPEFLGRGVALFDYDRDGDLDIYLPNGRSLVDPDARAATNALYRNDGDSTFTDVTTSAGVGHGGYGLGCGYGSARWATSTTTAGPTCW